MTKYQEDRTTMETQHLVTLQATSPAVLKPGLTRARYVEHMAKFFRGKATRLYLQYRKQADTILEITPNRQSPSARGHPHAETDDKDNIRWCH